MKKNQIVGTAFPATNEPPYIRGKGRRTRQRQKGKRLNEKGEKKSEKFGNKLGGKWREGQF